MKEMLKTLLCFLLLLLPLQSKSLRAQNLTYTKEDPLVYEDELDRWPYCYLDDQGEPTGYNIELLKIIFNRLNIPFRTKLVSHEQLMDDIAAGKPDLAMGMASESKNTPLKSGKAVVLLVTYSAMHPKGTKPSVHVLKDFSNHNVFVFENSRIHRMMKQRGWGHHAMATQDLDEIIYNIGLNPRLSFVHSTASLRWVQQKYGMKDMEITSLEIPAEEIYFRSADSLLLNKMDSVYLKLNAMGQLQDIQNRLLYPDRKAEDSDVNFVTIIIFLAAVLLAIVSYNLWHRRKEKKLMTEIAKGNRRLALILRTGKIGTCVMDVKENKFHEYDENGNITATLNEKGFYNVLAPKQPEELRAAIESIVSGKEKQARLDLVDEEGDFYHVYIGVLHRDDEGRPTQLIGAKTKFTEEKEQRDQVEEMAQRYEAIYHGTMADISTYDKEGRIIDMNLNKLESLTINETKPELPDFTLQQLLGIDIPIDEIEEKYYTQIIHRKQDNRAISQYFDKDDVYYNIKVKPVRNEDGELEFVHATGRDVTDVAEAYQKQMANAREIKEANEEIDRRVSRLNYLLDHSGIRLVNYSLLTHTFTMHRDEQSHQLITSQSRAMRLLTPKDRDQMADLFAVMEKGVKRAFHFEVQTRLVRRGKPLYLLFSLFPVEKEGKVVCYQGLCRDISDIKQTESQLREESEKAQEVEGVKDAFLRNMTTEIRHPLSAVVECSEKFQQPHDREEEPNYFNIIKQNTSHLLKLVNDTLYLSRLEAHMIDFEHKEVDIAALFEDACQAAWTNLKQPDVTYQIDNPYNQLVVELDQHIFDTVVKQLVGNAAAHTFKGLVRARYDYNGQELVIVVTDSGDGIPREKVKKLFDHSLSTHERGTGLGLLICHEIISQMGGKITIDSEVGRGTTVWATFPCKMVEFDRK